MAGAAGGREQLSTGCDRVGLAGEWIPVRRGLGAGELGRERRNSDEKCTNLSHSVRPHIITGSPDGGGEFGFERNFLPSADLGSNVLVLGIIHWFPIFFN